MASQISCSGCIARATVTAAAAPGEFLYSFSRSPIAGCTAPRDARVADLSVACAPVIEAQTSSLAPLPMSAPRRAWKASRSLHLGPPAAVLPLAPLEVHNEGPVPD